MNDTIKSWLLEDTNPEVKLRTLLEYLHYDTDHPVVIKTKELLLSSKIYRSILNKLHTDKKWSKFDAIMALAEWGLTREDVGNELDEEIFELIRTTNFKMLCGEPLLLRNLLKLGYYDEPIVKDETYKMIQLIKDDGGFGCISSNKKINHPNKPHKSCARLTAGYLLLAAELKRMGIVLDSDFYKSISHYFTKRNIFYRMDNPTVPMVDIMLETFYPPDPIKIGVQNIMYALRVLECPLESEAMKYGIAELNRHKLADETYKLTATKSVPAFKAGIKNKSNKWITLYAYMCME